MKYARLFTAALFTTLAASPYAQPQERIASPLLPKIYATFRAADLDRDGDLTQAERDAVGLPKADSKAFDLDGDSLWCEGEFVLYYRRLLKRNGKKIDRALELEAGRINRAYMDATNRGLNRDAAKRAADAVRAGTLEAAKERESDSQEVLPVPEFGPEPPADLASEFSGEGEQPSVAEPAARGTSAPSPENTGETTTFEPFAENEAAEPEAVENEAAASDAPEDSEESAVENTVENTGPHTVPPSFDAPFEVPTWGPPSEVSEENATLEAEFEPVQEVGELDGFTEVPETPQLEGEGFEPAPVVDGTAPSQDSPSVEESTAENEMPFVLPEFTRPDAITAPAPEVTSEEAEEATETTRDVEGAESGPDSVELPEGWPTLEELKDSVELTPQDEDSSLSPLTSEAAPEETPSPAEGSGNSTGYDVFGEPTIEEASPEEPLSETEEPTAPNDSSSADAVTETAEEKETAQTHSEETEERPLTDAELSRLREEQDAAAVRNRYGFDEPAAETEEQPAAESNEESAKPEVPAQKVPESPQPEVTSPVEPKSEVTEEGASKPETPIQEEPAQEPATPDAAPKKEAADKPLSLWERAERARKKRLREQQEKESQSSSQPSEGKAQEAEKPSGGQGDAAGSR